MVATYTWAENGQATVTAGGNDAPSPGSVESWTLSASTLPSVTTGTNICACADTTAGLQTETVWITNITGATATVVRGAEGTTPVTHAPPFTIQNVIPVNGLLQQRKVDWTNVVDQLGADPSGSADCGTIIANAIAALPAGGGVLYFPAGTYTNNTAAWAPVTGLRMTGPGYGLVTIQSTANSLINAAASQTFNVEIDHLTLACTNAHIFTGGNLARWSVHDCGLTQNSAGFAIWSASVTSNQILIESVFERNLVNISGATRTVEAWFLTTASGASEAIAHNVWRDNVTFNNGNDQAKYIYHIQSTSNVNNSNSFVNEVFEHPFGGMIWLESHSRGLIEHCYAEDLNSASGTISNSLVYISKNSGGGASNFNTVINAPRIASGVTFAGSISDIQFDSNGAGNTIINPQAPSSTLILDVGNSSLNTLIGLPTGYTLNNFTGATWAGAKLANITPAPPSAFHPVNPPSTSSGTTLVMMGFGTVPVTYTPRSSGTVLATVTGSFANLTAANNIYMGARYGSGTAPSNGGPLTGTRWGGTADPEWGSSLAPVTRPFAFTDVVSLTPGTAYWFDLGLATGGTSDAAEVLNVSMTFMETS